MSNYLSDNDDDLFDYDPSLSQDSAPSVEAARSSSTGGSTSSVSGSEKDFVDSFKNNINTDLDADLDSDKNLISAPISHLYSSFHDAVDSFISSVRRDHHSKSVHITLDQLTDGRFSLVNLFYFYEMRLGRRIALVKLFGSIFHRDSDSLSPLLEEISSLLKIKFTSLYYQSTFLSTINILNHTVMMDRIIYQFLAGKTGLSVQPFLLNDVNEMDLSEIETLVSSLDIHSFRRSTQDAMFTAFFKASDNDTPADLPAQIEEAFSIPAKYMNSYKTM